MYAIAESAGERALAHVRHPGQLRHGQRFDEPVPGLLQHRGEARTLDRSTGGLGDLGPPTLSVLGHDHAAGDFVGDGCAAVHPSSRPAAVRTYAPEQMDTNRRPGSWALGTAASRGSGGSSCTAREQAAISTVSASSKPSSP
jgi:hypothetical protein